MKCEAKSPVVGTYDRVVVPSIALGRTTIAFRNLT